jgi:uncharacterized membrane protein
MLKDIFLVVASSFLLGGILESVYRSIHAKRFVRPILVNIQMYVFSSVFLYFIYLIDINFILKVLLILIFTTSVEYLTGALYLKYKGVMLWDYSGEKYNYKGLISLKFSVYWVLLSLIYYFLFIRYIV